jgi:hypothetical protein
MQYENGLLLSCFGGDFSCTLPYRERCDVLRIDVLRNKMLILFFFNFLQEKAVEATKQEKERKEEKTRGTGRHATASALPS